jgi:hypothetical protein
VGDTTTIGLICSGKPKWCGFIDLSTKFRIYNYRNI